MRIWLILVTVVVAIAAIFSTGWLATSPAEAQDPGAGQFPVPGRFPAYAALRTADDKPDLNGIWQAVTTANWDLEAHAAAPGPYPELLGAWGAQPGGLSIVEGGTIPYLPSALARRQANFDSRTTVSVPGDGIDPPLGDPELKCWMPGVPRSMYMPFSASDRADTRYGPYYARVQWDLSDSPNELARRIAGRQHVLYGLVAWSLGGRYAGHRCDGAERAEPARSGGQLFQ